MLPRGGQATPSGEAAPMGLLLAATRSYTRRFTGLVTAGGPPSSLCQASSQCLLTETWIPRTPWIISFNWASRETGDSCHGGVSGWTTGPSSVSALLPPHHFILGGPQDECSRLGGHLSDMTTVRGRGSSSSPRIFLKR